MCAKNGSHPERSDRTALRKQRWYQNLHRLGEWTLQRKTAFFVNTSSTATATPVQYLFCHVPIYSKLMAHAQRLAGLARGQSAHQDSFLEIARVQS